MQNVWTGCKNRYFCTIITHFSRKHQENQKTILSFKKLKSKLSRGTCWVSLLSLSRFNLLHKVVGKIKCGRNIIYHPELLGGKKDANQSIKYINETFPTRCLQNYLFSTRNTELTKCTLFKLTWLGQEVQRTLQMTSFSSFSHFIPCQTLTSPSLYICELDSYPGKAPLCCSAVWGYVCCCSWSSLGLQPSEGNELKTGAAGAFSH